MAEYMVKREEEDPKTSWTSNSKEWTGKSYIEAVSFDKQHTELEDHFTQPSSRGWEPDEDDGWMSM